MALRIYGQLSLFPLVPRESANEEQNWRPGVCRLSQTQALQKQYKCEIFTLSHLCMFPLYSEQINLWHSIQDAVYYYKKNLLQRRKLVQIFAWVNSISVPKSNRISKRQKDEMPPFIHNSSGSCLLLILLAIYLWHSKGEKKSLTLIKYWHTVQYNFSLTPLSGQSRKKNQNQGHYKV